MTDLPTVAVVGRPNVGKSTLVNRILGRREAIVEERPGVTRDRKSMLAEWAGRHFVVVDTGGWVAPAGGTGLDAKVSAQSQRAIAEADVVVMVADSRTGVLEEDARMAALVRGRAGPTFLAVNKVDATSHEPSIWEFVSLGLGDPWPLSALHGRGAADLLDAVVAALPPGPLVGESDAAAEAGGSGPPEPAREPEDAIVAIAIVGRPNVGKSTLFNRLIGEDRSVVHDEPGTTRDSIDTVVETDLGPVRFVDTAGMRRRSRIDAQTEYYSMVRALRSVDAADVALLVVDATQGITHQDQRLAERIDAAGCPIVVVLNKWELLDTEARADIADQVATRLRFLPDPPVLRISALTGKGVSKLVPSLSGTISAYRTRVSTRDVNKVVRAAQVAHPAPGGARVLYASQVATDPPTFILFANRELPRTYLRYLENRLRDELGLGSVPIKLRVRRRAE